MRLQKLSCFENSSFCQTQLIATHLSSEDVNREFHKTCVRSYMKQNRSHFKCITLSRKTSMIYIRQYLNDSSSHVRWTETVYSTQTT